MTKSKSTKRALLISVLSIFVCFTMLIGTTYAWFTDSVTSAGNVIKTGTLDVSLKYADEALTDPEASKWTDAATGPIFNYSNWEPGYTAVKYVKIENEGSLDLKFILNIIPNNEAEEVNLADVIEVYMVGGAVAVDRAALTTESEAYVGTLTSLMAETDGAAHGVLYADDADKAGNVYEIYTIALKMSESAGNEYQNKSVGGGFAVQLLATQLASENDSLGNDYDANATYPNISVPVTIPAEDVTAPVTLNANGMNVEVPAEVINALPATVTSVSLVYSEPKTESNMLTFSSIDLVDQNDNVIDLEGNTEALTVSLPAQTVFAAGTTVHIYHDGEFITDATVNSDNTISYTTKHFCEVIVTTASAKVSYRPYILNGSRKAIQIDMENINASKSLVIELWHGDTLLTTTTYAGSYPYVKSGYTTCCVAMPGSAFFSWDTTVADGVTLTENNVPDMIKVYADGILVNTFEHSSGTVFADKLNDYLAIIPE